jgi:hypothetical protein
METFAATKHSVADAGWPVRIRMGKRSGATESGERSQQLTCLWHRIDSLGQGLTELPANACSRHEAL